VTYIVTLSDLLMLQVTLSIELDDSQVDEFKRLIPIQLAEPPWNYTHALDNGITVNTCIADTIKASTLLRVPRKKHSYSFIFPLTTVGQETRWTYSTATAGRKRKACNG